MAALLGVGAERGDELAVGDPGGARGLAGLAAEAVVDVGERGLELELTLEDLLHEEDAPARRVHLLAHRRVGRAGRQAEAAVHARLDRRRPWPRPAAPSTSTGMACRMLRPPGSGRGDRGRRARAGRRRRPAGAPSSGAVGVAGQDHPGQAELAQRRVELRERALLGPGDPGDVRAEAVARPGAGGRERRLEGGDRPRRQRRADHPAASAAPTRARRRRARAPRPRSAPSGRPAAGTVSARRAARAGSGVGVAAEADEQARRRIEVERVEVQRPAAEPRHGVERGLGAGEVEDEGRGRARTREDLERELRR